MLKLLVSVLVLILGGYLMIVAMAWFGQSRMIYFPTATIYQTPALIGAHYDDVWLTTEDNVRIHGWHVRTPDAKRTLLFFHGNGGNISHRLSSIRIFLDLGLDVFIIDYRGYGRSEGKTTEQGTYLDAKAAWDYLLDQGKDPSDIVMFGRSLGGAIAAWLAARTRPAGLILESTFSSAIDMARHHYPYLPVRLLARFFYDSQVLSEKITSPVLMIHSPDDYLVPYHLGRKLYDILETEKTFADIQGDHNEGFIVSGEVYTGALAQFLSSI